MRTIIAALALSTLVAGSAAIAQSSNYRSATVAAGQASRLWVVTAVKKDCTLGEVGGVRVLTPPKNGALSLVKGKSKTPGTFRCPNVETPVENVIYRPNARFTGQDEVVFETRTPDGVVAKQTIRITVSDKPAAPGGAADKKDGLQDL